MDFHKCRIIYSKIVKGFMAYGFDQKLKLPKFRLLNFRGEVGFTDRIVCCATISEVDSEAFGAVNFIRPLMFLAWPWGLPLFY